MPAAASQRGHQQHRPGAHAVDQRAGEGCDRKADQGLPGHDETRDACPQATHLARGR